VIDERFRKRDAQNTEDFYNHRKLVLNMIRTAIAREKEKKR
jgi:hypothetical protein